MPPKADGARRLPKGSSGSSGVVAAASRDRFQAAALTSAVMTGQAGTIAGSHGGVGSGVGGPSRGPPQPDAKPRSAGGTSWGGTSTLPAHPTPLLPVA